MKLRCTSDSVRIRLRKSELTHLKATNLIEERVHFGGAAVLSFALRILPEIKSLQASLHEGQIVISLPIQQAHKWIDSQMVGIEAHLPLSETQSLHVLIEKDFPCLDREGEDKADTFWELAPDTPDVC